MQKNARIANFNIAVHLDEIVMESGALIERSNWITGFPTGTGSQHFKHRPGRQSKLIMGECAAIVKNHHIDCTDLVEIGKFATIGGYHSQLLTHAVDVLKNRQDSAPIHIGNYTFVGTNATILAGAVLPAYSVLAAKSLLNKKHDKQWAMYGGVPAIFIKCIPNDAAYFSRQDGFIY
jgi:acetyltransferase-like isoleucine patch superfamily enzyme